MGSNQEGAQKKKRNVHETIHALFIESVVKNTYKVYRLFFSFAYELLGVRVFT